MAIPYLQLAGATDSCNLLNLVPRERQRSGNSQTSRSVGKAKKKLQIPPLRCDLKQKRRGSRFSQLVALGTARLSIESRALIPEASRIRVFIPHGALRPYVGTRPAHIQMP